MRLHFEDSGTGSPVVLIHAYPLSSKMWQPQTEALLKNGYRVIAPDLPGFGQCKSISSRFSIREMAQKILELIDFLDIEKAIFGGLSMGGYVLFELLRLAPERFLGLILCDTTHLSDTDDKRKGRFELISKIEQSGAIALVENMLPNLISDETKQNDPILVAQLKDIFSNVDPTAAINALRSMAERKDSSDLIGQINVPTLLVFGESDKITNLQNADEMHELISGSELQIIKKAGHYSNLEQPEEFNRVLLNFCQRIEF